MKHIAIIGTILILLILTAGCLDDLSSTLPPCCDGTCDGVKTSVITVDTSHSSPDDWSSKYYFYAVDADGISYALGRDYCKNCNNDSYYGHNVTFSYEMVDGHRHITGIIEDHDAKPKCDCYNTVTSTQNEEYVMVWYGENSTPSRVILTTAQNARKKCDCCQCVQKCCGCGE